MDDRLEVTQADRVLAAPYMGFAFRRALNGECDDSGLVQQFAQARLAGVKEGLEMAAKHLEAEAVAYRHGQEHANSPGDKLYRMGQKDACLLEATAIRAIPVKADH